MADEAHLVADAAGVQMASDAYVVPAMSGLTL